MKSIHKFPIELDDRGIIDIPGLQKVLSIAVQYDRLVLYAMVDVDDKAITSVPVVTKGTGHIFSDIGEDCWAFMGSHVTNGGNLVWHVWIPLAATEEH